VAKGRDDVDLAALEVLGGGDDAGDELARDRGFAVREPAAKELAAVGLPGGTLGDAGRAGQRSNLVGSQVVRPDRLGGALARTRGSALLVGLAREICVLFGPRLWGRRLREHDREQPREHG
jgi:hypothetical protein